MKFLILFCLALNAYGSSLNVQWVDEKSNKDLSSEVRSSFENILGAQAKALDLMDGPSDQSSKFLSSDFRLNELITDLAVSRSGILGLSALKSNNAMEIKWRRDEKGFEQDDEVLTLDEDTDSEDLKSSAEMIHEMVRASGKVKERADLKSQIHKILLETHAKIQRIKVVQVGRYSLQGLRLDLNFSANGEVAPFTKLGPAFRLRMEWKIKERNNLNLKDALAHEETRFVVKILNGLEKAMGNLSFHDFNVQKISIGFGASQKKGIFGLWKATAGFVGYLVFKKAKMLNKQSIPWPDELFTEGFTIGEEAVDAKQDEKSFWPRKVQALSYESYERFVAGIEKSLRTASFFMESTISRRSRHWRVFEIKTINDLSYTGFLGLADFTSKGVIEIDLRRI